MPLEIEAKFLVPDFAPVRRALEAQGYTCLKPRTLMRRRTYTLREKPGSTVHEWARVRDEGDKVTMTYKHVTATTHAMGTEEIDLIVSDFAQAVEFMERLGFKDVLTQETYRETWGRQDLQVTLDEWPVLGNLVELEGLTEAAVQQASTELGFAYQNAYFGGVGHIYFTKYNKDMAQVKDLTFANSGAIATFLNS